MCTGLPVFVNGSLIFARTMEFGAHLDSEVHYIPAGQRFTAQLQDGAEGSVLPGKSWTSKYAYLGPNAMGSYEVIEGFNEKGLHAAAFYFPGYAGFVAFPPASELDGAISPLDLVGIVLGTCQTLAEVRDLLATTPVVDSYFTPLGQTPPIHWIIQESGGESIVVEFVNGTCNIHRNHLNVITNSPSFDWHVTNLNNYVNLSARNVDPSSDKQLLGLAPFGQGSGMLGLPGDFTPPSRFVRAVALSKSVEFVAEAFKPKTTVEGINVAWNLINNISIAVGTAQEADEHAEHLDFTQWTSVSDLANGDYYIRTYDNQSIRVIRLSELMAHDRPMRIKINQRARYVDVSDAAKPLREG